MVAMGRSPMVTMTVEALSPWGDGRAAHHADDRRAAHRLVADRVVVAARPLMLGLRTRTVAARALAERAMTAVAAAGPAGGCAARRGCSRGLSSRVTLVTLVTLGFGTHRRGCWHVLVGWRRHDGDALVGQALDALQLAAFAAVAKRQRDARGAGARGRPMRWT